MPQLFYEFQPVYLFQIRKDFIELVRWVIWKQENIDNEERKDIPHGDEDYQDIDG